MSTGHFAILTALLVSVASLAMARTRSDTKGAGAAKTNVGARAGARVVVAIAAPANGARSGTGPASDAPSTDPPSDAPLATSTTPGPCPHGMALIEGEACTHVEQRCLRWMDPPGRFHRYRCAEYAPNARCAGPRVHERFCIDRRERTDETTGLPLNRQSWTDARTACEAVGARMCLESEWTFACEGQQIQPYPYGYSRTAGVCNADRTDLLDPTNPSRLKDQREPGGSHPGCKSPFGIFDMAGNVAEWVTVDGFPEGSVVVQKGNWWQPGKHTCRDSQGGHNRFYKGMETGFRCCQSAND